MAGTTSTIVRTTGWVATTYDTGILSVIKGNIRISSDNTGDTQKDGVPVSVGETVPIIASSIFVSGNATIYEDNTLNIN